MTIDHLTTLSALSQWLNSNTVRVGLGWLHVYGPEFSPRSDRVIQPEITNAHALRLISRIGKTVRQCLL